MHDVIYNPNGFHKHRTIFGKSIFESVAARHLRRKYFRYIHHICKGFDFGTPKFTAGAPKLECRNQSLLRIDFDTPLVGAPIDSNFQSARSQYPTSKLLSKLVIHGMWKMLLPSQRGLTNHPIPFRKSNVRFTLLSCEHACKEWDKSFPFFLSHF